VLAVQYAGLAQMIFSENVSLLATSPRVGSVEMREKVWHDLHQMASFLGAGHRAGIGPPRLTTWPHGVSLMAVLKTVI